MTEAEARALAHEWIEAWRGTMTGEFMEVPPSGRILRVVANYGGVRVPPG
jgi:hypothetical protein